MHSQGQKCRRRQSRCICALPYTSLPSQEGLPLLPYRRHQALQVSCLLVNHQAARQVALLHNRPRRRPLQRALSATASGQ